MSQPVVSIVMGSQSDWPSMQAAAEMLVEFGVPYETRVISAHRTPDRAHEFATNAQNRGIKMIIAGAGMAAHLAGVMAALTPVPVLGVPMEGKMMGGLDALLSTAQMPGGVPVATFGVGKHGAKNAALHAVSVLALSDATLADKYKTFREIQSDKVPLEPAA